MFYRRIAVAALTMLAAGWPAPPARAQEAAEKLELGDMLKDLAEVLRSEMDKAEPGDNKEFTVSTDDNIAALEVNDQYSNNGAFFKVSAIRSKGTGGGKFVVQRTAGKADPGQRWALVSGSGPQHIASTQTLLDLYAAGGLFMHPIAVLALVTVLLAFNSLWIYRRHRQVPPRFVNEADRLLDAGDLERFEDLALREKGLFPYICRSLADRVDISSPEEIKSRAEIAAGAQISRLRIPVKALNLIAAAAPLLGLLGTIVGMVIVFEAVATATGAAKAAALAAGIRVKLFCTAGALCVAIPSLFLFFIFNSKLGLIVAECEMLTEQFLHKIVVLKRNGGSRNGKPEAAVETVGEDVPTVRPPISSSSQRRKEGSR